MEKEVRRLKKINLALAVAEGESISAWARQTGVPERTAQRWAQDRNVRREVDACRRRALNEAIGRLTGMTTKAADRISTLAQEADSESVQLRASRAILADMIAVSKFSDLEHRMTEIEEQLHERTGYDSRASRSTTQYGGLPGALGNSFLINVQSAITGNEYFFSFMYSDACV